MAGSWLCRWCKSYQVGRGSSQGLIERRHLSTLTMQKQPNAAGGMENKRIHLLLKVVKTAWCRNWQTAVCQHLLFRAKSSWGRTCSLVCLQSSSCLVFIQLTMTTFQFQSAINHTYKQYHHSIPKKKKNKFPSFIVCLHRYYVNPLIQFGNRIYGVILS